VLVKSGDKQGKTKKEKERKKVIYMSSKETFIVEWKIRLPGSKTPIVFPLHLGMTAEEAINVICRHFSLKNKKLTSTMTQPLSPCFLFISSFFFFFFYLRLDRSVVLSPTASNPGKIIPEDTVLRAIEPEVGSEVSLLMCFVFIVFFRFTKCCSPSGHLGVVEISLHY